MKPSPACTAGRRLRSSVAAFAREDQGAATVWNVTWLLVFAGMAGLSIDSSNGYRNISISQSTSDVASLAGAMELPNPFREIAYDPSDADDRDVDSIAAAKASAVQYAFKNMNIDWYGEVLTENEVLVGHWDKASRTFTPVGPDFGGKIMNSVRVYLQQDEDLRGNGVGTSLMGLVGLYHWDVTTTATAQIGVPQCYLQGFMSKEKVCQTANNHWYPGHCIYGHEGIRMTSNNTFEPGVQAGLPTGDPYYADDGIPNDYKAEYGGPLAMDYTPQTIPFIDDAGGESLIHEVAQRILAGDAHHMTPQFKEMEDQGTLDQKVLYLNASTLASNKTEEEPPEDVLASSGTGGGGKGGGASPGPKGCEGGKSGGSSIDPLPDGYDPFALSAEANVPNKSDPDDVWNDPVLQRHRIYYTENDITITSDLRDVVIVTTGNVEVKNGGSLENVTLVSLNDADNGKHSVFLNDARLGNVDACKVGGEVKVYTMGSIKGNSSNEFYGTTLVAGGSVGFAAKTNGTWGVAVYAGGNIFHAATTTTGAPGLDDVKESGACAEATAVNVPDEYMRVSIVD